MTATFDDIRNNIENYDYAFGIWTDRANFICDKVLKDEEKLLEIRCFGSDGEFYAFRSSVDSSFTARVIENDKEYADGFFDKDHYLDIDDTKSKDCLMKTTGGGSYNLPLKSANRLVVRFYYTFDEDDSAARDESDGVARKCDWRLVGFKKEGEE